FGFKEPVGKRTKPCLGRAGEKIPVQQDGAVGPPGKLLDHHRVAPGDGLPVDMPLRFALAVRADPGEIIPAAAPAAGAGVLRWPLRALAARARGRVDPEP